PFDRPHASVATASRQTATTASERVDLRVRMDPLLTAHGPSPHCVTSVYARRSFRAPRIDRVLKTVADEVERQNRQQQCGAREEHVPPRRVERAGGVSDHLT